MRQPIIALAWRLAADKKRLTDENTRLLLALAIANASTEQAMAHGKAWQSRAELLYAAAPAGMADAFLRDLTRIDDLEET